MLIIRGEIHDIRSTEVVDRKTGTKKTNHYLQLITKYPSAGNGFSEEIKLPDNTDLQPYRDKIGQVVEFAVRPSAFRDKIYLAMLAQQPAGALKFSDPSTA